MSSEMSERELVTVPCRLAFPALFDPKPVSKQKPDELKYQAVLLLPPDTDLAPFYACVKAAMVEKFGKVVKLSPAKNPIRSCEEKEDLEGYDEGWHYINTKGGYKPTVVDQALKAVDDPSRVYPGLWCKFHLVAYGWKHDTGGNGVSFSLEAVQMVKDDDRLDSRKSASDLFEPLVEVSDDDDDSGLFGGDDAGSADDLFA